MQSWPLNLPKKHTFQNAQYMNRMSNMNELISQIYRQAYSLGEISHRSMFGGYGFFCDGVVFALMHNECFYIRSYHASQPFFEKLNYKRYQYVKSNGIANTGYYALPPDVLSDETKLLIFIRDAIFGSLSEKLNKDNESTINVKRLPNMSSSLARALRDIGIYNANELKGTGSLSAFRKLKQKNHELGIKVLFRIEGAIKGCHHEALSQNQRDELLAKINRFS
ncbi:TfoX/Sxy family DNA transformation protein [Vibrio anguillarum]|nr:hypothetical protein CMV05_22630 [Vibrio anguillarum]MBF4250651.1 TfoX/Sxy family DNA transformation protein [Vibrio anguillarum]MBF4342101.1 TfoX/Sxy family DNA transformation protein [Vibrio anguillarum]